MPFDDLVEPNSNTRKKYDSHKSEGEEDETMDFGKEEQKQMTNPLSAHSPRGSVSSHSNFEYEEPSGSSDSDGDFEDC